MSKRVWLHELRNLKPQIRHNFLDQTQRYDDQEPQSAVMIENDVERRAIEQRLGMGHLHGFGISPAMRRERQRHYPENDS
jgi:hypothetical protein